MEQLLILNAADATSIRNNIERKARVVQEGSNKLLVIEGSAEEIQQAASIPGVVIAEDAAPELANALSASEQIFLAAWRQRKRDGDNEPRTTEGQSWGAKGFRAP